MAVYHSFLHTQLRNYFTTYANYYNFSPFVDNPLNEASVLGFRNWNGKLLSNTVF